MKKTELLKKGAMLMRSATIIILFLFIVSACISEEFITIEKTINDENDVIQIQEEKLNINTDRLVLNGGGFRKNLLKVEGIEKLTKLKKLLIEYNVNDLSYLYNLSNIEILIFESDKKAVNLDFLLNLKKLKVCYIESLNIKKTVIDLKNNKQLEYMTLANLFPASGGPYFYIEIINIPKSLKYLDLFRSHFIIKSKEFLDSLKNVPYVFLGDNSYKDEKYENVDENYFLEHKNFIFKYVEDVVPEKYKRENIYALIKENN